DRTQDAAEAAIVVRNGTVREGDVRLFRIALAKQDERQRLVVGARIPSPREIDARTDLMPYLRPDLGGRRPKRSRMPEVEELRASVVVEIGELFAPPHEHRLPRGEDDPHARAEIVRPARRTAQGRPRPVERPHPARHVAVAWEDAGEISHAAV